MNNLQQATALCEEHEGEVFVYLGEDPHFPREGVLEILEDMNCCDPTQNVLFALQGSRRRKVMEADELVNLYQLRLIQKKSKEAN